MVEYIKYYDFEYIPEGLHNEHRIKERIKERIALEIIKRIPVEFTIKGKERKIGKDLLIEGQVHGYFITLPKTKEELEKLIKDLEVWLEQLKQYKEEKYG